MNTKQHSKTVEMVYIALFSVIITICSWISIPFAVPFTLQTFAIFAALGLLGGKRGTLSVIVWLLLGAIGIPVFSGFTGGLGVLFGSTGGYILGFVLIGIIYSIITYFFGTKVPIMILAMLIGLFVCYTFGTVWFILIYTKSKGAIGVITALSWCVFPFIIPDFFKMALAILLTKRLSCYIEL
ncbi:MAG: biotin transporter BioY [Velocimicrobium sp.]